jgi:hypothetical protein
MRSRQLAMLVALVAVCVGCAVDKGMPDGMYINNPSLPNLSNLPDPTWVGSAPNESGYGYPLRPIAILLSPVGMALDWALMRPFYMLGGVAPKWFGFTVDDSQAYHNSLGEPMDAKTAPRLLAE